MATYHAVQVDFAGSYQEAKAFADANGLRWCPPATAKVRKVNGCEVLSYQYDGSDEGLAAGRAHLEALGWDRSSQTVSGLSSKATS